MVSNNNFDENYTPSESDYSLSDNEYIGTDEDFTDEEPKKRKNVEDDNIETDNKKQKYEEPKKRKIEEESETDEEISPNGNVIFMMNFPGDLSLPSGNFEEVKPLADSTLNKKIKLERTKIEKLINSDINNKLSLSDKILLSNLPGPIKATVLQKIEDPNLASSDRGKAMCWGNAVLNLPLGTVREFPVNNQSSNTEISKFLTNAREILDKTVYGMNSTKEEIIDFLTKFITNPSSRGTVLGLHGDPGLGKCFSKDTPILMFNGSIKMVQDIIPGELLMGDDSTPREVLTLGNGRDTMYKVTNVKGENYTVNSEHILCLKYSKNKHISNDKKNKRFRVKWFNAKQIKINQKDYYYNKDQNIVLEEAKKFMNNIKEEKICEIPIKKYLDLSKTLQKNLKGYSVPVEFTEKELDFDPYIMGLWLGDGPQSGPGISNQDSAILKYLSVTLPKYKCYLQHSAKYDYRINGEKRKSWDTPGNNNMLNVLRKHNMIKNKHIPHIYKCNSRQNRLKLLAGIIDSDGSLLHDKSGYNICQSLEHNQIIDDTIYLARSLGFSCYKGEKKTSWTYQGVKKYGKAWSINISGEGIEEIPVLCPRKKANPRKQIKDVLVSGITVEKLKEDNYYGFMIDGNERFILGNFIVTHNTKICMALSKILSLPYFQISFGGLTDTSILVGHDSTYVGSKPGLIAQNIKKAGCINPVICLDEIDKLGNETEKSSGVYGILTHLLDETQNNAFQDLYFDGIPIDLSKALFIATFNEISKIDPIVLNRIKVINIKSLMLTEKINIVKQYIIPDYTKEHNVKFSFSETLIEYTISRKTKTEPGMRNIKKNIETIFNRVNTIRLLSKCKDREIIHKDFSYKDIELEIDENGIIKITKKLIDNILKGEEINEAWMNMYI